MPKQHLQRMMTMTMIKRDAAAHILEQRAAIVDFSRASDNDEGHLTFPLSSEEPYQRFRGVEVLDHTKDAVDLSFLNSGAAPLLFQHNSHSGQIGVITKARLDETDKRIYVSVRFSRRPEAQAVKQDIEDGIMRNVSVGYNTHETENTEREGDDVSSYRVTSWTPMEASIVSIPADQTVGIGRSNQPQEATMAGENNGAPGAATRTGGLPAAAAVDDAPINVMSAEQRGVEIAEQMSEINALARSHNVGDLAQEFIAEAVRAGNIPSLAVFRGKMRENLPDAVALVNGDVGLQVQETQRFSIMRLARSMAEGATQADLNNAQFEREACEQAAQNFEGSTNGWRLPEEVMRSWSTFEVDGVTSVQLAAQRAAMSTTVHTNVQTVDHLAGMFIDNLRNRSSVMQAGATILPGLSNDVEIPGADANSVALWLAAEDADAAETVPTFRKITLSIKDIAGYTDITRRMLQQSTIAIEQYVRSELLTAVALGIDSAGLEGSGASGIPEGVKNTTGIGSVTFAALGAPVRTEIIEMWSDVASANADVGALAFIDNALMVAHFMDEKVDAGSGRFMMDGPTSPLLAMRNIMSNQVTDNDLFFGNWADLLMGMWGGLDLDRSTEAKFLSGGLRLRAIQSVDFGVRRVSSFTLGNGGA
jgi:HK97 family phage major capsid protein/HK97 family phage prohead protease